MFSMLSWTNKSSNTFHSYVRVFFRYVFHTSKLIMSLGKEFPVFPKIYLPREILSYSLQLLAIATKDVAAIRH